MLEEHELTGEWWLPSDPTTRFGGTLLCKPGLRPRLRLAGSFVKLADSGRQFVANVVLGKTAQAGPVALLDCRDAGSTRNLQEGGGTESILEALALVRGLHCSQEDQILLTGFTVELSYIDEWADLFRISFEYPRQRKGSAPYRVTYDHPTPVEAVLDDGASLKIGVDIRGPQVSRPQKGIHVETATILTFVPASPISLSDALKRLRVLGNLLCLATQEPIFPLRLSAVVAEHPLTVAPDEGKIEILLFTPDIHEPQRELRLPHDMLFVLSDIADNLGQHLDRWFLAAEEIEEVLDLYFATRYQPRMYLQHCFLSLTQAVEGFHRLRMDRTEVPAEDYAKRMEVVLSSVTAEYRPWLERVLEHSNEANLATRLSDMCKEYRSVMNRIDRKRQWIDDAVRIRNYLAHGKSGEKPYDRRGLLRVTERLRVLVELGLMSELGFGLADLEGLVERHWRAKPPLLAL